MLESSPRLKGQAAISSLGSSVCLGPGAGRRTHSCGKLIRAGWADSHISARFPLLVAGRVSNLLGLLLCCLFAIPDFFWSNFPALPSAALPGTVPGAAPSPIPWHCPRGSPLPNPTQTPPEGCTARSKGWMCQWEGGPCSLSSLQSHQGPHKSHMVTGSHVSLLPA